MGFIVEFSGYVAGRLSVLEHLPCEIWRDVPAGLSARVEQCAHLGCQCLWD